LKEKNLFKEMESEIEKYFEFEKLFLDSEANKKDLLREENIQLKLIHENHKSVQMNVSMVVSKNMKCLIPHTNASIFPAQNIQFHT
jgi:hypothetical protein